MIINKWIKSKKVVFTPGGDSLWECGNCGCGEHIYGIETPDYQEYCPNCGSRNYYPWEKEKCVTCKYFHELKYGFEIGKGFKKSGCCIALTRLDENVDEYESFVIEAKEDDMCEMWTNRQ